MIGITLFRRIAIATLCSVTVIVWQRPSPATQATWGTQGMVVSANGFASEAGLKQLQAGGNAVDAAVATTFAISVLEPQSAGIGGGGFLLWRSPQGKIEALDFRERAPLAATREMYLDAEGKVKPEASTAGYLAVGVPGTVAGLYEVHQRYGRLPWAQVVAPAIQLAEQGFRVSPRLAAAIAGQKRLQQNAAATAIFYPQGQPLQVGDRLVQRDLGQTLRAIAANPQSFYTGPIARAIVQDMQANRGLITQADLQTYRPLWRDPVCGNFRAARVCSMPPPSSGGVHLVQMLNMLNGTNFLTLGWHDPDALHRLIETMRIAYADRAEFLGDPDFVKVPVAALTSPAYAQRRAQEIDPRQARPFDQVRPGDRATIQRYSQGKQSNDTSHLSVVDGEGGAISLTFTVNLWFGSGVVTPGTGIVLNNEMDDFASAPGVPNAFGLVGNEANAIAPRKTPLSSMTPTIVTENNQLRMVVGAPGGSTIITTVLQIILNVLVYDLNAKQAIAAARLHHQWLPNTVRLEKNGFDRLTVAELQRRGHKVEEQASWGNAAVIIRQPDGLLEGASDPRGEGAAAGY